MRHPDPREQMGPDEPPPPCLCAEAATWDSPKNSTTSSRASGGGTSATSRMRTTAASTPLLTRRCAWSSTPGSWAVPVSPTGVLIPRGPFIYVHASGDLEAEIRALAFDEAKTIEEVTAELAWRACQRVAWTYENGRL